MRSWLSSISDDIDAQLVRADDLAALGRSIEPGFRRDGEPTSAEQIRLNSLSPSTDFDAIHGQLETLKTQLPTLDAR